MGFLDSLFGNISQMDVSRRQEKYERCSPKELIRILDDSFNLMDADAMAIKIVALRKHGSKEEQYRLYKDLRSKFGLELFDGIYSLDENRTRYHDKRNWSVEQYISLFNNYPKYILVRMVCDASDYELKEPRYRAAIEILKGCKNNASISEEEFAELKRKVPDFKFN